MIVEMNKGPMVNGPWDGKEHSVLINLSDYPDGPPSDRTELCRLFSVNFPEGAAYRWDTIGGKWRYVGVPSGGETFSALLRVFNVKPAPSMGEETSCG